QIKNKVKTEDPKEQGLRNILNVVHTIGHAIEGYSLLHDNNALLNGEAIANELICEAYLSHKQAVLSDSGLTDLTPLLLSIYPVLTFEQAIYPELIELMMNDKKNENHKIGFSLLTAIGECSYNHYVSEEDINESLDYYLRQI